MSEDNTARDEKTPESAEIAGGQCGTVNDYFFQREGDRFAALHLIVDLWDAEHLDDEAFIESALRDCVDAAGATLLHIHLHRFTENGGISGVAILAESHISIHSWPEHGYAAMDIFMCGDTQPHRAIDVLRDAFKPKRIEIGEHRRGRL
jgi:S-adenosylmethionine decarboxylase